MPTWWKLVTLLGQAMVNLAEQRPVFHSEADFQLALSMELQTAHPAARIRLERRMLNNPRVELDVFFVLDGQRYALELKYPKRRLTTRTSDGEQFHLTGGAADVERYGVIRDLVRCEQLLREGEADQAAAIVLSNVPELWTRVGTRVTGSDAFRLTDGLDVTGHMDWGVSYGRGSRQGRTSPLTLVGSYLLRWVDYGQQVEGQQFRYLTVVAA